MNKVYGLTGGIASGKSTVAAMLRARGARVIDADRVARDVVAPGSPGLEAVIARFGEDYRVGDALDRAALADLVFADPDARRDLNAILHPLIAAESAIRIGAAMAQPGGPIFYDAALLVENGAAGDFAALVVVACSEENQVRRLIARDGLDEADARARLDAQLPLSDKVALADHVVWNDGSLDDLASAVDTLLTELDTE